MTRMSAPSSPQPAAVRPPAPPAGPVSNMTPLDPVKLLKKYAWLLTIAAVIGGAAGVGGFFIWLKFWPSYVAQVLFEIKPAEMDPSQLYPSGERSDEFERFVMTIQNRLVSETIMDKVARDPRLPVEAPNWCKPYMDGQGLNYIEAAEALKESVSARPVSGTSLLALTATAGNATDVTALAKLVKETFINDINSMTTVSANSQKQIIRDAITDIERQLTDLNDRRARRVTEEQVDSLDDKETALGQQQRLKLTQLAEVNQVITQLNALIQQMESMRASEAGITYSDSQRQSAAQDPIVMGLRQQLNATQVELQQLRQSGVKDEHREFKRMQARIDSIQQQITQATEEALARNFDAEYDGYMNELRKYQAQNEKLTTESEELRIQLADLTRTISELEDIDRTINELIAAKQTQQDNLANLTQQANRQTAGRVAMVQAERKPNQVSQPKLLLTVPAGIFLFAGAVGGVVVLRELLDQRVKGPSDVTLLPRAKVIGMVPSSDEDPSVGANVSTVFRDAPSSVVAEHFRQLRTTVVKHLQRHGFKSLVVLGGMPGSGASTVVTNLGLACAGTDLRVLIVDGNFRRPAQHRLLKVSEGPGLADLLAGLAKLDDVITHVPGQAKLDAIPVGSSEHRVYERLGAAQMTEFLNSVKDRYDVILIDVAPALVSGDGLAVANRADASMLVVRALGETRGMVARLRNDLDDCRAELLGVLVNAVRSAAGGYMRQNIRVSRAYHTPGVKVGESIDYQPAKE